MSDVDLRPGDRRRFVVLRLGSDLFRRVGLGRGLLGLDPGLLGLGPGLFRFVGFGPGLFRLVMAGPVSDRTA